MKTALITGANKGIGFESAKQLLESGYFVFIGSRNIDNGESAVQQLKEAGFKNTKAIRLDVADISSIEMQEKRSERRRIFWMCSSTMPELTVECRRLRSKPRWNLFKTSWILICMV